MKKQGKRIQKLLTEEEKLLAEIDSLNILIFNTRRSLDSLSNNLSLNSWQKAIHHNDLLEPFTKSTYYRRILKDNYKKEIVELRKRIYSYESDYEKGIDELLYQPSSKSLALGLELIKMTNQRESQLSELYKKRIEMVRLNLMDSTGLIALKSTIISKNEEDYCWLESKAPFLISSYLGFDFLKHQQRKVLQVINTENDTERNRLEVIYHELIRRKRKYNTIVQHNMRLASLEGRRAKRYKRNYLQQQIKENNK